jgi:uncharacterized protein (DUF58 family)
VGLLKGINLLALLGYLLLAVAALNAWSAGRGQGTLRARRRVADPVVAGQPCRVGVEVRNPGRRARWGVRLEDGGPDHALRWFAPRLAGGAAQTFEGEVVLPRRGRYAWGPVWAAGRYPFGLAERRALLVPGQEVIVLPPLGTLHRGRLRRRLRGVDPGADRARRPPRPHPAAQAEIHGLRAFRTGDSPRAIHWRTSARRGELMVREFEDVPPDGLVLVFDPALPPAQPHASWAAPRTPAELFEDAVSLAATVARAWCRQTGDRLVLAAAGPEPAVLDGFSGPAHAKRLLEYLALAEPHPAGAAADAGLLARLAALRPGAAAVLLVSVGPSRLSGPLRHALRRPVTAVEAADAETLDFYDPPPRVGEVVRWWGGGVVTDRHHPTA